ncbi:tagatose-bisphosphate aldolase [Thermosipho melanesiensis]|uniref:Fructose-1,6-bisphosphate aldolase, class II n=2 Tax=Thermosipho melanesiensis TaxID=46541 RepID=A6LMH0_THEM4|nr:class II fructose-1,6-bisphosphate aldolase [Thermosipho melanesiensis]ABR31121.1 fructose-1,6-bisphosphate aldolase, class II [Thermosipho melanesiensis BI429]APT74212.1 tagatose-bisphosphate aldolase [Thermosipho melanesiensis]OOC36158.1 tagatose-bisphosphate aldolase [Thermosipho melanesiensis]OOC36975.1 tagatose-bisphosphate aldolase [Thermosipho melanesiensis]OOC37727.1 tagatose-bisphosphate aldolase [Thermosipho melanesiensis]
MYVNTKEILEDASKKYYAVPAFNINNLEFLMAILQGAVEKKAPIIIETSEGAIKYAGNGNPLRGARFFAETVKNYAESLDIPVALHLDHGKNLEYIAAAIKAGYSSVMIDASHEEFEKNLEITKEVVKWAHAAGVSVEAELGQLAGIEDNVVAKENVLVDPQQAKIFVEETNVDFLAPAIGTSHGAFKFKGEAKLDFERLKRVKELTKIPLVLHGASSVPTKFVELAEKYGANLGGAKGVPQEDIKKCVELGINKVNTDTDLRIAFLAGLRKHLSENEKEFDPRKYFKEGMEFVKEVVMERLEFLNTAGKA